VAASLLEDVKITVFGKEQNRNDVLQHTDLPLYESQEKHRLQRLVQMDLMTRGREAC